jgi:hypothetical protein
LLGALSWPFAATQIGAALVALFALTSACCSQPCA